MPLAIDLQKGFVTFIDEEDAPLIKGRQRWRAQMMVDRRQRYIGEFDRFEDAVTARRAAELANWGEQCPAP
jgi:hypothetical protein